MLSSIDDNPVICAGATEMDMTAAAIPQRTVTSVSSKAAAATSATSSAADVVSEQGQAAAAPAVRPPVTEEDISKWIKLPRQGSKIRATRGVPSAEEPWQV